jgi:hypothetical protein
LLSYERSPPGICCFLFRNTAVCPPPVLPWNTGAPAGTVLNCWKHYILCSGDKEYSAGRGLSRIFYGGINNYIFQQVNYIPGRGYKAIPGQAGVTVKHYILCF